MNCSREILTITLNTVPMVQEEKLGIPHVFVSAIIVARQRGSNVQLLTQTHFKGALSAS